MATFHLWHGTASESIDAHTLAAIKQDSSKALAWQVSFAEKRGLKHVVLLHQVHGVQGYAVPFELPCDIIPFSHDGDFLITNEVSCGVAVLTADCLPVVFYEPVQQVVGIAHAGWQGSIAGICLVIIAQMQKLYASKVSDLHISFGPCARSCCYEVGPDFKERIITHYFWAERFFEMRQGKLFFDLISFNKELMVRAGVPAHAFKKVDPCCTMCTSSYYSHRRQKEHAGRNITVVWLE